MYSKQEAAQINQRFWTNFGQYMKPVPFAGGEKNSWINYKTGVPHIHFRIQADKSHASIAIELSNPSCQIRKVQMDQLRQFKKMLHHLPEQEWIWDEYRIYQTRQPVNIFKEAEWPAIISFLKSAIIAVDSFWEEVKYVFE